VAALPFAAVQVDSALCSACGLCARFCPTDALHFTAEETHFSLSFQAALCLDCPVCTLACPEKAIRLGDTVSTDALLTDEWLPLLAGRLTPCHQCGVPTADQSNEQRPALCYSCRQDVGMVQPLRDGAGLMADLLTRSAKVVETGG
jgi:MinD superfamily P-loop ATPase